MKESNKLYIDLHAFSQEIAVESVRNLDSLKGTEPTPSQLNRITAQMVADTAFAGKAIVTIQELNILVDVDGSISEKLQQAQNNTNQLCDELGLMCKTSGRNGDSIESSIERAFAEAITTADNLHSILGILRTVIRGSIQTPELVTKFYVV